VKPSRTIPVRIVVPVGSGGSSWEAALRATQDVSRRDHHPPSMTSMTQPIAVPARKATSPANFFLWWRVDPAEVERQVAGYDILGVTHSARKGSAALCVLSVVITAALGGYLKMPIGTVAIEAVVWGGLALAMVRGNRWAFAAGMVLWTLEKAFAIVSGTAGRVPVVHIIWWAIYMHSFLLAYRVETARSA
jgi:hypothetical protein